MLSWGVCLAAALIVCPSTASARDWPETAGWEISEGDDFCLMHMEYEGPGDSSLAIGLYADGRIIIANVNYSWSAEKGRAYPEVSFELNDQSYTGTATGIEIVGKKGFAMKFGQEILADIAAARAVHVYKGETLVDRLKLDGSAAALGVTKRCLGSVRAKIAATERERQRWADIPKDPFASDKAAPRQAIARGSKTSWITNDDYPPAALRAREQGTVVMDLRIDRLGRVENCEVSGSSGSALLDKASCSLVQRRARYTPATDENGDPTSSTDRITFRWSIPQ